MLDNETKRRIDSARDILVGKIPDPKAQVEQITTALVYKFMDDMDKESIELGGKPQFFTDGFGEYSWTKVIDPRLGGFDRMNLYVEAITKMAQNPHIPPLFRTIFKDAFLPYRDPETLNLFLKEINCFIYDHSERLGDAFEYLLSVLGSQGEAGQFRTPRHIIDFMVEVIAPEKSETILDPACGTAGFLISSFKHIMNKNKKNKPGDLLTTTERKNMMKNTVGYDISPDMVRISLVNMYLHGFPEPKIYEYDTLTSEDRWDDIYDVILANPPFMSPKGGIRPHKRFSVQAKRSEVLFVDYIAEHLMPTGRAAVIVPEGIIFQSGTAYKQLRKILVENHLFGVVSLPAGVFNPYSGVKTSILLMDKTLTKRTDKIIFVKVENDGFDLGAQRRAINKNDLLEALRNIKEYVKCVREGKELDAEGIGNVLVVEKENICGNKDWNLSMERYRVSADNNSKFKWKAIKEIVKSIKDGDWIESKDQSKEGIRLVQTGNVGIGEYLDKIEKSRFISNETFARLKCTEVIPGDILLSRLPDPVGRACLMPKLNTRTITAVDCSIIKFDKEQFLPELFVFLTKTDEYYKHLTPYLTGSSRRRISRKNLEEVKIPIPPLEIQKEIVAEIESYQKIIDGARQVVENYKPQIQIDPEWEMVELGNVLEKVTKNINPQEKDGEVNYIGLENISQNTGELFGNTITEYKKIKSTKLLFNSKKILYGKLRPNLNKVWLSTFDGICSTDIFVIKSKSTNVNIGFYSNYLRSEIFNNEVLKGLKGAQLPRVGWQYFSNIKIPYPPIKMQNNIALQLEKEQQLVNANKELIKTFEQKIKDRIARVWGE